MERLIARIDATGSADEKKKTGRKRTVRIDDNVADRLQTPQAAAERHLLSYFVIVFYLIELHTFIRC